MCNDCANYKPRIVEGSVYNLYEWLASLPVEKTCMVYIQENTLLHTFRLVVEQGANSYYYYIRGYIK